MVGLLIQGCSNEYWAFVFLKVEVLIDNITEVTGFQEVLDLRNNDSSKKSTKGQQMCERMFNVTNHKGMCK